MEFSNDNIINFITGIIELGGAFKVDENPDKLIHSVASGEVCTLPIDGGERQLAAYGSMASDVVIINPFAEGESNTTRATWFYHSRNLLVGALIIKCMRHLIEVAAKCHDKKYKETKDDLKVMKFLGKYANKIDNKLINEVNKITESLDGFITIYYNKKERKCNLNCLLERDVAELKEIYKTSNIRVSSWDVLKAVFHSVVGVKDIKEYQTTPVSANIPVFESFIYLYLNLFDNMRAALKLVGIDVDKVDDLKGHLKYLEMYYQKAKWCTSTSSVVSKAQVVEQPKTTVAPWQTSNLPSSVVGGVPMPTMGANNVARMPTSVTAPAMNPYMQPAQQFRPQYQQQTIYPQQQPGFVGMSTAPAKPLPASVYGGNRLPSSIGFGYR